MGLYDPGEFPTEVPTPTVEAPSLDFTVADVLAWARTKPADEVYEYDSTSRCALCQFLLASGLATKPFVALGGSWADDGGSNRGVAREVINDAARARPHDFGSLVQRLEALQS